MKPFLFNKSPSTPFPQEAAIHVSRTFERLIQKGFQPKSILDIGCYHGKWTSAARHFFPAASFTLIDAIHYPSAQALTDLYSYEFHVSLLYDQKTQVEWYEEKNSGDSIFRERTAHFASTQPTIRMSTTLDLLLANKRYDLIKIDAQGAELPILRGGHNLVQQAEVIAIEIPFCGQYNSGVPDFLSHIVFMDSIGFRVFDLSETHYFKGILIQVDIFFVRHDSHILRNVQSSIDSGRW